MATNPQPMVIGLLDDHIATLDTHRHVPGKARRLTDLIRFQWQRLLDFAERLRESPNVISLKIHHERARRVLPENELLSLIEWMRACAASNPENELNRCT